MIFAPMTQLYELQWLQSRATVSQKNDTQGIVAYDNETIVAVCVADSFTVDGCCLHAAIDNPFIIRRGFLDEVFSHLFIACGRERIFAYVSSANKKALKFDKHIGFKEVTRIPDALAEGIDQVIFRMDKEDCRWLTKEQKEAQCLAA